jgi:predicted polyphosphate/ATP-dependent NAD kinase
MRRIGFLINPVAGMGGAVGLKGTDGQVEEARRRGAVPQAERRGRIPLDILARDPDLLFFTASGEMGESLLAKTGITQFQVVHHYRGESTAEDTRNAVHRFLEEGVDLILFCGGDGTAREIFDVAGREVPILGIPTGVKMYSALFAIDPATAAEIVDGPTQYTLRDAEVMDVDEEAYRKGDLQTRLYGVARTPALPNLTQVSKQVFEEGDEERAKKEIARFIGEVILPDTIYILGAGTTTEAIASHIGVKKTLLGVDVVKNGSVIAVDADEKTLVDLLETEGDARIVISPIGAQGFILGRGNQQISPRVVERVGVDHIIIVATPHKLRETPVLYVDSGDPALDRSFGPSVQVISGYRIAQRKRIYQPDVP